MTSCVGASGGRSLSSDVHSAACGVPVQTIKDRVMGAARQVFRPEFLNRIDDFVGSSRWTSSRS